MSLVNFQAQRSKVVQVIVPVDNDGTAVTSVIVDRLGYDTAKLVVSYAASSGSPTTALSAIKVYSNSASSSSSPTPVELVELETALNIKLAGIKEYDLDLSGAKRYVYATLDTTYADGSSPKNIISAVLELSGKNTGPAVASTEVYGR